MMMVGPLVGPEAKHPRDAPFDYRILVRALHFIQPRRWMILAFVLVLLAEALLELVPALMFRSIIDDALPQGPREPGDAGLLALLSAAAVAAIVGSAIFSLLQLWLSARIGEGIVYDLRVAAFDHVQRLPLAFFTRTQTGALMSRLDSEVVGAQRALTNTLGSLVSNTIIVVTTLLVMFSLDWRSTLLAVSVLPAFLVAAKRFARRLRALTREQMDLGAVMNASMTERLSVSGALLVKLFGRHEEEGDRFAEDADRVRTISVRAAVSGRTFFVTLAFVGAFAMVGVYWLGGERAIDGEVSMGTLVALAALAPHLYGPLIALSNVRVDATSAIVSFERVFEVLDIPNPVGDRDDPIELPEVKGAVSFDDVSFRYPMEGSQVLRNIDVAIAPGQFVAVVGPSGSGKTTLVNLIPRLYDVTEGVLRVDGVDVRDLRQESLRKAVGLVSQDPHFFHDSIRANLLYANPDAEDSEIERACRAAHIHDFITELPDGYATVVGERGLRLSGGERQRLAIARMLLKDPAVMILDEATSHLDSENEASVSRALSVATGGRTSIVIAHRISTITAADLILVLDKGCVVERGTHAELSDRGGLYAQLYRILAGQSAVAGSDVAPTRQAVTEGH